MRGLVAIGIILLVSGCSSNKSPVGEEALYSYVRNESNGLIRQTDIDGFHLEMVWKPTDLIAQQQMIKGTKPEFDSLKNYFSRYLYFTLQMTYDGKDLETKFGTDPASFADKISFLSYGFAENIRLKTGDKTNPPLECIYSRSYGMGTSQCLIVFEMPTTDHLEVDVDGTVLGFGRQTFPFRLHDIKNAPQLKI